VENLVAKALKEKLQATGGLAIWWLDVVNLGFLAL